MSTPLEISHALRTAAEWVRNPDTNGEKCPYNFAQDWHGRALPPTNKKAVKFCALGYLGLLIDEAWPYRLTEDLGKRNHPAHRDFNRVADAFNRGDYDTSADIMECVAAQLEESLQETEVLVPA